MFSLSASCFIIPKKLRHAPLKIIQCKPSVMSQLAVAAAMDQGSPNWRPIRVISCGSAALPCGKPLAFRSMPHLPSPSAQAGRLSLPTCAEEVPKDGCPSERQSLFRQPTDRAASHQRPSPAQSGPARSETAASEFKRKHHQPFHRGDDSGEFVALSLGPR